jgi:hypothetical protein
MLYGIALIALTGAARAQPPQNLESRVNGLLEEIGTPEAKAAAARRRQGE